jgi:hypothetical protein
MITWQNHSENYAETVCSSAKEMFPFFLLRALMGRVLNWSFFALAILLACDFSEAFERRLWTDNQSRKVEAALVRGDAQTVILKLADGREAPFPIEKLSPDDRAYIEENRALLPALTPSTSPTPASKPAAPIVNEALNFNAPWPDRIKFSEDPEVKTVEENAKEKRFIYESANYRYVGDVRLAQSVVKGFADYVNAGGPPENAGVFIGGRGVVMVTLTSLGVRPVGSGYMLDRDKSSKTLAQELAHQLTMDDDYRKGSMGWFSEGLAEYIATTPYRDGVVWR